MSAFHGPQGQGAMKRRRDEKRAEAEARQEAVAHERTRAHRLGTCNTGEHLLREIFGGAA